MVLSDERIKGYIRRLLKSRMRILCTNGFYGLLIMHMLFALDEKCPTVATDGSKIYFNPEFLDSISDSELDYILLHEILHIVLQQCSEDEDSDKDQEGGESGDHDSENAGGERKNKEKTGRKSDEIVNSIIEKSCGMKVEKLPDDDHSKWKNMENDEFLKELWQKRLEDAAEAIRLRDPTGERGLIPKFAQRMLDKLKKPQTDWRTILNSFVQEEITDYSFMPPDRRMDDCDFFLPDFNEKEDIVTDILFMIDTSFSMSDNMITAAYSEVKGAIDQFDGRLTGWLGFFDAAVVEPKPFSDEGEFQIIKPVGGGGTDFMIIFEYVRTHMQDKLPASIIILTDGYAPFPKESDAMGIPVLWLLNNEKVNPEWGKVARIVCDDVKYTCESAE